MQDIWRDTLDSIKALFLRTLTDMAAQALVKQILIPVGVTSGGYWRSVWPAQTFGGGGTGTTTVPGAAVTQPGQPACPRPAANWARAGAVGTGAIAGITVQGLAKAILDQSGAAR